MAGWSRSSRMRTSRPPATAGHRAARPGAARPRRATTMFAQTEAAGAAESASAIGPAYGALTSRQISRALLSDFLFRGGGAQASQALPPAYYAGVESELADLRPSSRAQERTRRLLPCRQAIGRLPSVERPSLPVGVEQHAQLRGLGRLRRLARTVADPQPLAPGRDPCGAGAGHGAGARSGQPGGAGPAPAGCRCAKPSWRSSRRCCAWPWSTRVSSATNTIPAGRLMERVAQRSFKYNDEFSPEFAGVLLRRSDRGFNCAQPLEIDDAQPFERRSRRPASQLGPRRTATRKPSAAQAPDHAACRGAAKPRPTRSRWDLSMRADLDHVPGRGAGLPVRSLGAGAGACTPDRHAPPDRPRGYGSLISDLLWSVKPRGHAAPAGATVRKDSPAAGQAARGPGFAGAGPAPRHEAFFRH